MHRSMGVTIVFVLVGIVLSNATASEESAKLPTQRPIVSLPDRTPQTDQEMTARIDEWLDATLVAHHLTPAWVSADAEFLRRLSLDLIGVIPAVAEVREFLADTDPMKRRRWIDRMLDSPRHATHLATTWRRIILPTDGDPQQLQQADGLRRWLREQFATNLRYDRFVAEFLSSTGDEQSGPAVFYRTLDADPAKLAAATSRMFLGLQIQCAQCHDHPFDSWKQEDFWGYAAFFAQLRAPGNGMATRFELRDLAVGEVHLPDSDNVVPPKYPGGEAPGAHARGTRRRQLAIWMASGDNPYLGRAAVNRVWADLFGRGLVNPVDDLGGDNLPSHPELFQELSEYFTRTGFDLQRLYRILANTRAYQRAAVSGEQSAEQAAWFAAMPIKRFTADQLFDSLERSCVAPGAGNPNLGTRLQFIAKMESTAPDRTDYDLGIQQALELMNGIQVARATTPGSPGILTAIDSPLWSPEQRIEILFLATLSRPPRNDEVTRFGDYLARSQAAGNSANALQAYGDILWALLNSAEYQFNH